MSVPPYDWLTLTIRNEFAMNLSLFDDLSVLGDADGAVKLPPRLLQDGWVWRDGEFARNRVTREANRTLRRDSAPSTP